MIIGDKLPFKFERFCFDRKNTSFHNCTFTEDYEVLNVDCEKVIIPLNYHTSEIFVGEHSDGGTRYSFERFYFLTY